MKDWDRQEDGEIALWPLVEWRTAMRGEGAALRLQYASSPDQLETEQYEVLQLWIYPHAVRPMADALRNLADLLEAGQGRAN